MASPLANLRANRARPAPEWIVLSLACVAQFMVLLDVSIVNVALPSIRHSLGYSQSGLQWVLNAYTLTFAGFLLLGGRAADLFGRRRMFLLGLFLFSAASLLGGLATSQATLIAARAAQGLGGAILSPTTLTILTTTFTEPKARSRALGLWSAVAGAGGAAGALLGGVLTQYLSWRWILFINLPIGVVAFAVARVFLVETRAQGERQRLDVTGAVLVTGGLTALVYGVVRTTSVGWTSWQTIVAIGVAVILIAWFLLHEARVAKSPLVPLTLLAKRSVWSANLVMLLLSGALFAMWYFVSLYLQDVLGYSPLRTGFAFVPQTLAIIVGSQVSSRLILKVGARALLIAGTLSASAGLFWLAQVGVHTSYWSGFFVPSVLVALGLGLCFTPIAFAATAGVPPRQAGLASGFVNTSRQIGGAVGLAALATIAISRTDQVTAAGGHLGVAGPSLVASALTAGYTRAFFISGVIALGSTAAALLVPKLSRPGPRTEDPGRPESDVSNRVDPSALSGPKGGANEGHPEPADGEPVRKVARGGTGGELLPS